MQKEGVLRKGTSNHQTFKFGHLSCENPNEAPVTWYIFCSYVDRRKMYKKRHQIRLRFTLLILLQQYLKHLAFTTKMKSVKEKQPNRCKSRFSLREYSAKTLETNIISLTASQSTNRGKVN